MAGSGMIAEALAALVSGDYPRSQELLSNISKLLPASSKSRGTAHNAAVVSLYANGGHSQESLDEIVRCAYGTLPEEMRPDVRDVECMWGLCGDISSLEALYSACGTVHMYNLCVIAYNTGRISTAKNIGAVLYDNIEAMEDWLGLRVAFLLVDVHLKDGNFSEAMNASRYAERIIPQFKDGNGNGNSNSKDKLFPVAPEKWGAKNHAVLQPPISYDDARYLIAIYKDRITAANPQGKKNESQADDIEIADEQAAAVRQLIRARIEVDDTKVLALLEKLKSEVTPAALKKISPHFFNTLGIVHHRMGLSGVACCYFERSRSELLAGIESGDDGNNNSKVDSRVAYNLGIEYMRLEEYKQALGYFTKCAKSNEVLALSSPHLWIRMAECCVAEANKHVMYSQGVKLEGCGRGRRLELNTKDFFNSSEKQNGKRLFSYATICARTSISILDMKKGGNDNDNKDNDNDNKLRSVALAMLAYAMLEVDAKAALAVCNDLVDVSSGIDSERAVLGRLYGAEALCMLGRPNDAVERLAPLLAMRQRGHSGIRDSAFVNVALAHSMRGDMATAVRAAKAALKVTTGTPTASNISISNNISNLSNLSDGGGMEKKQKASYRRDALLVATYVFLREGDLASARTSLHQLRTIPVPKDDENRKNDGQNESSAANESNAHKGQVQV